MVSYAGDKYFIFINKNTLHIKCLDKNSITDWRMQNVAGLGNVHIN